MSDQAIENEIQATPNSALLPHQQRVIEERNDLREKIQKLNTFLGYGVCDLAEERRLQFQEKAMGSYLEILNERIGAFTA